MINRNDYNNNQNFIINKKLVQDSELIAKNSVSILTSRPGTLKKEISKEILKQKKKHAITFHELSEQSGIPISTIKAISYGKNIPNIEQFSRIVGVLPAVRKVLSAFIGHEQPLQIVSDRDLGLALNAVFTDMIGCKNNYTEEAITHLHKANILIQQKIRYSEYIQTHNKKK